MTTPDPEFDPNASLEDWDWIKPEDIDLFRVSDEEFDRQQEEFWNGDRQDARKEGTDKKRKRVFRVLGDKKN